MSQADIYSIDEHNLNTTQVTIKKELYDIGQAEIKHVKKITLHRQRLTHAPSNQVVLCLAWRHIWHYDGKTMALIKRVGRRGISSRTRKEKQY